MQDWDCCSLSCSTGTMGGVQWIAPSSLQLASESWGWGQDWDVHWAVLGQEEESSQWPQAPCGPPKSEKLQMQLFLWHSRGPLCAWKKFWQSAWRLIPVAPSGLSCMIGQWTILKRHFKIIMIIKKAKPITASLCFWYISARWGSAFAQHCAQKAEMGCRAAEIPLPHTVGATERWKSSVKVLLQLQHQLRVMPHCPGQPVLHYGEEPFPITHPDTFPCRSLAPCHCHQWASSSWLSWYGMCVDPFEIGHLFICLFVL